MSEPWLTRFGVPRWKALLWGDRPLTFLIGICVGFALACFLMGTSGCGSSTRIDPATTKLGIVTQTETRPDGTIVTTERREGEARGPGGSASGDKASLEADGKPANLDLTKGRSTGGGGHISGFAEGSSLLTNPFTYVSLILLLGTVGLIYFRLPTVAVYTGAGSIVCGIAAFYPVVFLWGGLALLVLGSVWAAYSGYVGKRAQTALKAVVAGVANTPGEAAEAVKEKIAEAASIVDFKGIDATIDSVKRTIKH